MTDSTCHECGATLPAGAQRCPDCQSLVPELLAQAKAAAEHREVTHPVHCQQCGGDLEFGRAHPRAVAGSVLFVAALGVAVFSLWLGIPLALLGLAMATRTVRYLKCVSCGAKIEIVR